VQYTKVLQPGKVGGKLPAWLELTIDGGSNGKVGYHASCSVEVALGDRFGPFEVVATNTKGANPVCDNPAPAPPPGNGNSNGDGNGAGEDTDGDGGNSDGTGNPPGVLFPSCADSNGDGIASDAYVCPPLTTLVTPLSTDSCGSSACSAAQCCRSTAASSTAASPSTAASSTAASPSTAASTTGPSTAQFVADTTTSTSHAYNCTCDIIRGGSDMSQEQFSYPAGIYDDQHIAIPDAVHEWIMDYRFMNTQTSTTTSTSTSTTTSTSTSTSTSVKMSAKTCGELGWNVKDSTVAPVCSESVVNETGACYSASVGNTVTYDAAVAVCDAADARLCTADELEQNIAKGTGCVEIDDEMIWTSEYCGGAAGVLVAYGAAANASNSSGAVCMPLAPLPSFNQGSGSGSGSDDDDDIKHSNIYSKHGVRCCADKSSAAKPHTAEMVAAPLPKIGGCEPWCVIHHVPWYETATFVGTEVEVGKCTWTKNCGGCGACYGELDASVNSAVCQDWCGGHPTLWGEKCLWMDTCAGCTECLAPPFEDAAGTRERRSTEAGTRRQNEYTSSLVLLSAGAAIVFAVATVLGIAVGSAMTRRRLDAQAMQVSLDGQHAH